MIGRDGQNRTHALQQIQGLCGAFNPRVDLIAEFCKVDRLCQKRLSAVLKALRFVSASPQAVIMMTGTSGRSVLELGKSSRPFIPGMLMSERIKDERYPRRIRNSLERHWGRLGEIHCKTASAEVAPELLAEQNLDISLIVNRENKQAHARPPDLAADRELTEPITCIVGHSRAMNSKDAAAPRRNVNDPVTAAAPWLRQSLPVDPVAPSARPSSALSLLPGPACRRPSASR